jgi:hypothetical protein
MLLMPWILDLNWLHVSLLMSSNQNENETSPLSTIPPRMWIPFNPNSAVKSFSASLGIQFFNFWRNLCGERCFRFFKSLSGNLVPFDDLSCEPQTVVSCGWWNNSSWNNLQGDFRRRKDDERVQIAINRRGLCSVTVNVIQSFTHHQRCNESCSVSAKSMKLSKNSKYSGTNRSIESWRTAGVTQEA